MDKFFNTAGPCMPDQHYMLPAQERCQGLLKLIDRQQYFVIHAARQTGKTTLLMDLVEQLNESGDYYALYCSLETAYGIVDTEKGIQAIVSGLKEEISFQQNLEQFSFAQETSDSNVHTLLRVSLRRFCRQLDKPLVILFDEVDCLFGATLISFLRQLRDGYANRRKRPFVHSVALVGMRNIRDYKSAVRDNRKTLGSASLFNIVKTSKTLRNFNEEEVARLYGQHTAQTGQQFQSDVIETVYHYTQGQPWLVNAIADEVVEQILSSDFSCVITSTHIEQAVEVLITRRDVHIDSLLERLKEKRIQRFVEPVITGSMVQYAPLDDDYSYILDMGLLREADSRLVPANPIYGEVMIRLLSHQAQIDMEQRHSPAVASTYLVNDKLDMKQLLSDFQQFWRENSEIWQERYQYKKAAPHLVLQAFLQRIINGGGRISRELAAGTGRLDLCVHYGGFDYPIELKIRHGDKCYETGKEQLSRYMDKLGSDEGWLVVFDQRVKPDWNEKIFWKRCEIEERIICIVGV